MKLLAVVELPVKDIDADITQNKEFDVKKLTLISPARSQALTSRFKRDAETSFVDAKRAMTATIAKIPVWFIVMTVVLGWNEFLAVMRSPLFFLTIAILGGGDFIC